TSKMDNRAAQRALQQMSPQERRLFQDGFVSRYVDMLREIPNRRDVLNRIANSPAALERLHMALGPQRANQLEAMVRVGGGIDNAGGAVQGNSTTARQLMELGLAGGAGSVLSGSNPLTDPSAALNAALVYGALRGGRGALAHVDERVARQVARLLTSNDPTALRNGMNLMGSHPRM